MPKITDITCQKIVNSRGDWTIETKVFLEDGSEGTQAVPEGASKGEREAVCLGPDEAAKAVEGEIRQNLLGADSFEQERIDKRLVDLDGTDNKRNLGANSILSVSLAVSKAAAKTKLMELHEYLGNLYGFSLANRDFPVPLFNILNGGRHAQNNLSFQEFMVIPARNLPFDKAYEMGVEIYQLLEEKLREDGFDVAVGDEGGFAPNGFSVNHALEYLRAAAEKKYEVGKDAFFGIDAAANSFREKDKYVIKEEKLNLSRETLTVYYADLLGRFELIYLEDPFYEKDTKGWSDFYNQFSKRLLIVGDDLTVTNPVILKDVVDQRLVNAVIVKPNQVGTLTETLEFIKKAREADMAIIISHRSGDTAEDTFIADLAVAVGADFIKSGAPARGERVAKYNRLLEIFNSR